MRVRMLPPSIVLSLLAVAPAWGWGRDGHLWAAKIAEGLLNEKARAAAAAILGPEATMESVSTWADEVRPHRPETATWHYINIPPKAEQDWRPYCPPTDCVVSIIPKLEAKLLSPETPATERREALMFLMHFVGDLHQPLHAVDRGDRGGNDVATVFNGRPGNLHSLWDTGLIARLKEMDPVWEAWVLRPVSDWERWQSEGGAPSDWVLQSSAASRAFAYLNLPSDRPAQLGDHYAELARPVIEQQIRKAGIRLATRLNLILGR